MRDSGDWELLRLSLIFQLNTRIDKFSKFCLFFSGSITYD